MRRLSQKIASGSRSGLPRKDTLKARRLETVDSPRTEGMIATPCFSFRHRQERMWRPTFEPDITLSDAGEPACGVEGSTEGKLGLEQK